MGQSKDRTTQAYHPDTLPTKGRGSYKSQGATPGGDREVHQIHIHVQRNTTATALCTPFLGQVPGTPGPSAQKRPHPRSRGEPDKDTHRQNSCPARALTSEQRGTLRGRIFWLQSLCFKFQIIPTRLRLQVLCVSCSGFLRLSGVGGASAACLPVNPLTHTTPSLAVSAWSSLFPLSLTLPHSGL